MMFQPQRAEAFAPAQKAVMPCGCIGVMLGHAEDRVQFGIEQSACGKHHSGDMVSIERNVLVTPSEPFEPFGG
jgi:hypothetical protein